MKKNLFVLLLFLLSFFISSLSFAENCITLRKQHENYTTWVYKAFVCLEKQKDKAAILVKLSKKLDVHLQRERNIEAYLNGTSAMTWIISHQARLSMHTSAYKSQNLLLKRLNSNLVSPYERAKILLPLANVWVEAKDQVHARKILEDLVQTIDHIPNKTQDHDDPKQMVLVSILELQNRAGFESWQKETRKRFAGILE